jgi:hypothetical protein
MVNPGITREKAEEVISRVEECLRDGFSMSGSPSAFMEAARRLGVPHNTVHSRIRAAKSKFGLAPDFTIKAEVREEPVRIEAPPDFLDRLVGSIRAGRRSLAELSAITGGSFSDILDAIDDLKDRGLHIHRSGDGFEIPKHIQPAFLNGPVIELVSRPDNTFLFGAIGDLHAGSKYTRWDVREDLYKRIASAGAQCVFDTGNWIDGEATFNRYDIDAHGLDGQCKLLAERHPKYEGLHTYAVWGDDHEGWYVQREGIDVGRYCEAIMREHGHEWTNLGFMEASVLLKNANTGTTSTLSVVHPGGGSAYALSYSIQKIVESYEGGEKPNVALYGHYHKLWAGIIRNIWVVQTGTAQDQTPFMRKKRLEAHVGGCLVKLEQDPESGAIVGMTPTIWKYFNKGFYSGRWSKHQDVVLPPRSPGNIV